MWRHLASAAPSLSPRSDLPRVRRDILFQGEGMQKIPTSPHCHRKHLQSLQQENLKFSQALSQVLKYTGNSHSYIAQIRSTRCVLLSPSHGEPTCRSTVPSLRPVCALFWGTVATAILHWGSIFIKPSPQM